MQERRNLRKTMDSYSRMLYVPISLMSMPPLPHATNAYSSQGNLGESSHWRFTLKVAYIFSSSSSSLDWRFSTFQSTPPRRTPSPATSAGKRHRILWCRGLWRLWRIWLESALYAYELIKLIIKSNNYYIIFY